MAEPDGPAVILTVVVISAVVIPVVVIPVVVIPVVAICVYFLTFMLNLPRGCHTLLMSVADCWLPGADSRT